MRHVFWIGLLLLVTIVGDRSGGALLQRVTAGSGFRYSKLYQNKATAEILLLGNSRGLIFYQPVIEQLTEKSTINLSYNALPMNLGKVLLEDYYDRYDAPELLLIDVTMCDRLNPELIAGMNCYTPYSERLYDTIYQSEPSAAWGGKISHLYRYNSEIFQRALFYRNKNDDKDWLLDRIITDGLIQVADSIRPDSIAIIPEMVARLVETINLAKARGTTVKLLINPYYPPYIQKLPGLTAFKEFVETKTGLLVYDYSQAISDPKYFGDYQHLNKKGSEAYMSLLLKDAVLVSK